MSARVQSEPFDAEDILRGFGPGAGALVTFTGIVRDDGGELDALEIEHYPAMTQSALMAYGQQAAERFELLDWCIVHRYGRLKVGEQIMMVATAARHRKAAFQGAEYLMDWLKSRAPFWKREIGTDGSARWVEAKSSDEDSLSRW
ncbi:molybdenum cofactor biosynthesis protein MoaE [Paracoccus seriniphilus]|uniref:Molybdopterin synthase catalytic subunit n=1 Tax=Paracoccus seriniphilus TaxID=184748 RepID=A0A239PLM4_9RHOB|nr:molybdenum cofactor biosynthesis protein MoaE [Paracoccus seriniphilus]WCR13697.1 molybdenum cofactor biosynthesis protein MoaE [Paracoccus seriniphilus]SNT68702.1 molybdopterin synthase subunit MoaE [Paracoccus seriniphilus]